MSIFSMCILLLTLLLIILISELFYHHIPCYWYRFTYIITLCIVIRYIFMGECSNMRDCIRLDLLVWSLPLSPIQCALVDTIIFLLVHCTLMFSCYYYYYMICFYIVGVWWHLVPVRILFIFSFNCWLYACVFVFFVNIV